MSAKTQGILEFLFLFGLAGVAYFLALLLGA